MINTSKLDEIMHKEDSLRIRAIKELLELSPVIDELDIKKYVGLKKVVVRIEMEIDLQEDENDD